MDYSTHDLHDDLDGAPNGSAWLVDRETGEAYTQSTVNVCETLNRGHLCLSADGKARYVLKSKWDGKVAKPAKAKA